MMDHDCILVMTSVQAIAGEAGVPFFYRAGSEFEEM
jgi:ATP-dependent Zn protease